MAEAGKSRVKSDQMKRIDALKEMKQFQIKIQNIERERGTHMFNKRSEFRQAFVPLEEMESKLTTDRKNEEIKISQQLTKIRSSVRKFRRELQDIKASPEFVEKLKVIMEDIEGAISSFKDLQRQNYETLVRDERTVSQEITSLEKKFETWAQTATTVKQTTPRVQHVQTARDVLLDLPPEVAAFDKFLQQTGGLKGGWDEYDHATFLKYRLRNKSKAAFITELIPALPTKTESEIRQHEGWYQEYLGLNEQKKEAIHKWKQEKEEEKELNRQLDDSSEDEEDEEKKMKMQKKIEQERHQRKLQLNAWKVQKEIEKAEAEEKKLRGELKQVEKEEQDRIRLEQMRRKVEDYKKEKEQQEQFERLEAEMKQQVEDDERRKQISKNTVRFMERDKQSLESKLAREKAKQQEAREKEEKLDRLRSQVEVHVQRDPSRLLKPTKGWEERQKAEEKASGQIYQMPHRAVPSWRQGMTS